MFPAQISKILVSFLLDPVLSWRKKTLKNLFSQTGWILKEGFFVSNSYQEKKFYSMIFG